MISGKCCGMGNLVKLLVIVVTLQCTAYCDKGITASGEPVRDGICAVDKINGVLVPFGAKVVLPDGRTLVVTDRFGAGHNNCVDIFMNSESECWKWGRQYLKCEVIMP